MREGVTQRNKYSTGAGKIRTDPFKDCPFTNKQDHIAQLQVAVSQLHNSRATWRETVPVHEVFRGETVWQGDVEVFDLHNHPKAKRAYAWSHLDGKNDDRTRFVAVLEIPPVDSAQKAVQIQIVKDFKAGKEK